MVEIKLQIYLESLCSGMKSMLWFQPLLLNTFLFSLSLFVLTGKLNQGNRNPRSLIFSFRSGCSGQVLPCGEECARLLSPGRWDWRELLCCPLLAEVVSPCAPTGKALIPEGRKNSYCWWGTWQLGSRSRATGNQRGGKTKALNQISP